MSTEKTNTIPDKPVKPIPELNECIFWERGDPRWNLGVTGGNRTDTGGTAHGSSSAQPMHIIDMGVDSYIWVFSGVRGAGKTTTMTYFAIKTEYMNGLRLLSNYPIEYRLDYVNGDSRVVRAEPLDIYRLLCFDNEYHNCLIVLDEAPDIISHMASMTWKNRLLNIFVRQLRKNHNSLFLGAQQFELIDKSMRWQTDIIVECTDASRKYGWGTEHRGKCVMLRIRDNSGMWTGECYDEAIRRQNSSFIKHFHDPALKIKLFPRVLWGDEYHRPVYDTYYQQDVFESLKKVDMKMDSYEVRDKGAEEAKVQANSEILTKAAPFIEEGLVKGKLNVPKLYRSMGDISVKDKQYIGHRLRMAGGEPRGQDNKMLDMTNFDWGKFAGQK